MRCKFCKVKFMPPSLNHRTFDPEVSIFCSSNTLTTTIPFKKKTTTFFGKQTRLANPPEKKSTSFFSAYVSLLFLSVALVSLAFRVTHGVTDLRVSRCRGSTNTRSGAGGGYSDPPRLGRIWKDDIWSMWSFHNWVVVNNPYGYIGDEMVPSLYRDYFIS